MKADSTRGGIGTSTVWAEWQSRLPDTNDTRTETPTNVSNDHADDQEREAYTTLLTKLELITRENDILRQRLSIADKQIEVKDRQINDFKALSEGLSQQNQVLLMLAQGVPMSRILKQDPCDIEQAHNIHRLDEKANDALDPRVNPLAKNRLAIHEAIKTYKASGMTHGQIANKLNEDGIPTLSMSGAWNRKKVGNALRRIQNNRPDNMPT
ncbi:hypothetical protein NNJEOMEG_00063 [Fundidesulfovibrio magnetotacticus]|uniref:Recombinase domain-containing protein n=1 Tax=Fundidesulfovibrio magnetotacticus TaxID=2730080 RepID=A0A6V8LP18_9BACT|nr:recombinase family protein [Fundidesulfovibrio magnetotacticus]GFK92241.1 hypothetical protein NNJEOMEG_00063 [Fundidesulfovibrio magnetotacticus]